MMDETRSTVDLLTAVNTTIAQRSAKLILAVRLDCPVPEPDDVRGEGIVDFQHDRVWMIDHVGTKRMAAERARKSGPLTRRVNRFVEAFVDRIAGGGREIYFEGGAMWSLNKDGAWGERFGAIAGPKHARHPLCMLDPLSRVHRASTAFECREAIRGSATTRYSLKLTSDQFDVSVWEHVADSNSKSGLRPVLRKQNPRKAVDAAIWLDDHGRIRRMSYEGSYDASNQTSLWSITEFHDFGISMDRERPKL